MTSDPVFSAKRLKDRLPESEEARCHRLALPFGQVIAYTRRAPYKDSSSPNEDRMAVIEVDSENFLLVVADGVGGSPAGASASTTVIDKLIRIFDDPPQPVAIPALVIAALEEAHEDIRAKGTGAASTVALVHLTRESARSAHAGDSVVLLCGQRGKLKLETIAHSPVGYALEAGVLSEDEAFTHAERHIVSNIIGGQEMHITLGGTFKVAPRDTLLIASDGVTDNLRQAEIIDTIRRGPLAAAGETLAERTAACMDTAEGKPDDMTFILFRRTA